jgi:hypothetical protein
LLDIEEPISIQSESPVSDTVVRLQAGRNTLTVEPPDAVLSFGAAADVDAPATDEFGLSIAHEWFCPYANAFPTETEYEEWDSQSGAITTAFPIEVGYQLARHVPDSERSF